MSQEFDWNKDWENFDWAKIDMQLCEVMNGTRLAENVDIAEEEVYDYIIWAEEDDEPTYIRFQTMLMLSDIGFTEAEIAYCMAYPEKMIQAIDIFIDSLQQ
jgi:hypothetical protein